MKNFITGFKRIFGLPGDNRPGDFLYLLLLAFCYGVYFLLVTIALYMPGGVVEKEEFLIYVQGWVTVPILSVLAILAVRSFRQRFFPDTDTFYPVLLGITVAGGLVLTLGLDLAAQLTKDITIIFALVMVIAVVFAALQLLGLRWMRSHRSLLAEKITPPRIQRINQLLPFGLTLFALNFIGVFARYTGYNTPVLALIVAAFLALFLHLQDTSSFLSGKRIARAAIDCLVIFLIGLACIDPQFATNYTHQGFYLGPVNALLHGGTMLVNVYSQYGVLDIELLSLFFQISHVPMTFQVFSFLIALFSILQFATVYFILRMLFKSQLYAILGLFMVLLLNFFATLGIYQSFPSVGPFRFGLSYLLLGLIFLRFRFPKRRNILSALEYGVFGLASIWSFESFVYAAAVFIACLLYQTLLESQSVKSFLRRILFKLGGALLSILVFQVGQALYIFMRAGQWPNWMNYLNYLFRYSVDGFGTLSIDPWSPWLFLAAVYFIGIMSFVVRWLISHHPDGSIEAQAMVYISLVGIAQFTYYLGRSHPNNLYHISAPAVILALYGFQAISKLDMSEFAGFAKSFSYIRISALILIAVLFVPTFASKIPNTAFAPLLAFTTVGQQVSIKEYLRQEWVGVFARLSNGDQADDAVKLIGKYAPDQPKVTVFINPTGTTVALILAKKGQMYPIGDPAQDSLSTEINNAVLAIPNPLQTGDTIFLASEPKDLKMTANTKCYLATSTSSQCSQIEIQLHVVQQICSRFGFDEIEKSDHGVSVMRLTAPGSGTSDYCQRVNTFLSLQDNS
jgi:hypothetical protein